MTIHNSTSNRFVGNPGTPLDKRWVGVLFVALVIVFLSVVGWQFFSGGEVIVNTADCTSAFDYCLRWMMENPLNSLQLGSSNIEAFYYDGEILIDISEGITNYEELTLFIKNCLKAEIPVKITGDFMSVRSILAGAKIVSEIVGEVLRIKVP